MEKIVGGTAPDKFTVEHLKGLGFRGSNDRSVIGMLKDLGFLSPDGAPRQRYHDYRDTSRSKAIMAEAIREAYSDIFYVSENPTSTDREAIKGKFKTMHNVGDAVADEMVLTFFAMLELADLNAESSARVEDVDDDADLAAASAAEAAAEAALAETANTTRALVKRRDDSGGLSLHYNIQIHLPATRDVEVFNAIFKSLKDNVLV